MPSMNLSYRQLFTCDRFYSCNDNHGGTIMSWPILFWATFAFFCLRIFLAQAYAKERLPVYTLCGHGPLSDR